MAYVLIAEDDTAIGELIAMNRALLSVSDDGCGMTPEQIKRACDPFYRADKARSRAQGGVGLGMSICAAIARAHGSQLRIESQPGQGAHISVLLPDEDANVMQSGGDLDAGKVISYRCGRKTSGDKEGDIMKNRIWERILAAALTAALCGGAWLGMPELIAWAEDSVAPAAMQTEAEEELIRLPRPEDYDKRLLNPSFNRELSDAETRNVSKATDVYEALKQSGETENMYPGSSELGDVPLDDGVYYRYTGDGVEIVLPERDITDAEMQTIFRFNNDVLLTAYEAYRIFEDGERTQVTQRESDLNVEMKELYKNGLRPETPMPTEPNVDGFWYDTENLKVHFTQTYEMTREQILELIDAEQRVWQYYRQTFIDGVKSSKPDEKWIAIGEKLMRDYGFTPPSQYEGGEWTVDAYFYDNITYKVGIALFYGTGWNENDDYWETNYCVEFDPDTLEVNRIYMPRTKADRDVGSSLQAEFAGFMNDPKWIETAKEYLAEYAAVYGEPVHFETPGLADYTSLNTAAFNTAVYVQVAAQYADGSGCVVDINPDDMSINGYCWNEDLSETRWAG